MTALDGLPRRVQPRRLLPVRSAARGARRQGRRCSSADQRHTYADVAEKVRAALRRTSPSRTSRSSSGCSSSCTTLPAFVWAFFAALSHGAVVAMGNPEAPAPDLAHLVEYTRAAAVVTIPRVAEALALQGALTADERPHRRAGARGPDRRRSRGRSPGLAGPRGAAGTRPRRPRAGARGARGEARPGRPPPHPARRHRHLALHVRLHGQEQGGHAHAPRLRLQHRGLRQGDRRLPARTTSPSGCRASSSATPRAPT